MTPHTEKMSTVTLKNGDRYTAINALTYQINRWEEMKKGMDQKFGNDVTTEIIEPLQRALNALQNPDK